MRRSRDPPPPTSTRRKLLILCHTYMALPLFLYYTFAAPYTKVEESFTLHAIHDVLAYPFSKEGLAKWDHLVFPGAVPRSFFPPVVLGLIAYPFARLWTLLGWIDSPIGVQKLVRVLIALVHTISVGLLSAVVRQRYGKVPRALFMALYLSQFHIPFYASRTLPNFMAMPLVNISIALILKCSPYIPAKVNESRYRKAIITLVAVASIFRFELNLFVYPVVLSLVFTKRISLVSGIKSGLAGLSFLLLSAPLDYTLWRPTLSHPDFPFTSPWQLLWPEVSSVIYNLFQGHASDWGVSPPSYYIVNALPKTCLASLPLALFGVVWWAAKKLRLVKVGQYLGGVHEILAIFGLGVWALVGGMSALGHKEWRFVIYVVPTFNLIAALTAASLWDIPYRRLRPLFRLGVLGLIAGNICYTGVSFYISKQNYPGGEVWRVLEAVQANSTSPVTVHYGNLALQTGSSLFTFLHYPHSSAAFPPAREPGWVYSKSEHPSLATPQGAWESGVDLLVTDDWVPYETWSEGGAGWMVVGGVDGYKGISRSGGLKIDIGRRLNVLRRVDP